MTNNVSFQNTEINPLFEKMQARFCKGGTIAERLTKNAKNFKKSHPHRVSEEFYMTHANSLPKEGTSKKKKSKKGFFSLNNIKTTCLLLLVSGTVIFGATAISTVREENRSFLMIKDQSNATEASLILNDSTPLDGDTSAELYEELSSVL